VWQQTGRTLTRWQKQWSEETDGDETPSERPGRERPGRDRRLVGLAVDPDRYESRLVERVERMLERGWIEETRAVRDGPGFGPTSIQALGYREVIDHTDGLIDRAELVETVVVRTRQFARRQRTWLKRFPEIAWVDAPEHEDDVERAALETLRALGL
jgi:tRNA dimethylallyltransferase